MSDSLTTVTPLASYRNETPYPFCPGCGHGPILDHLNRALSLLQLDPRQVVLVSDIGCSGLSDQYFRTNAFHGLHGRSITYASGIKLARPELTVLVIMGDGGTGIGGTHLINAARRNIGITVLVFNNLNFGMTGGQHSTTTPSGARTSTTPGGNLERPLDICATVAANGAGFVFRGTSFDADLPERLAEAIRHPGFGLLDIWELCTAYYVPRNRMSRKALFDLLEEQDLPTGVLQRRSVPEYAAAYRQASAGEAGVPLLSPTALHPRFSSPLKQPFRLVMAGSAGGKVRSAARVLGEAAILSGLWAAQRDDYPITVKTGHSISELILSPEEIHYTGISRPDALLVLTEDGRNKVARYVTDMGAKEKIYTLPLAGTLPQNSSLFLIDPAKAAIRVGPANQSLVALAAVVRHLGLVPQEALLAALDLRTDPYAREGRLALGSGWELPVTSLPAGGPGF